MTVKVIVCDFSEYIGFNILKPFKIGIFCPKMGIFGGALMTPRKTYTFKTGIKSRVKVHIFISGTNFYPKN